MSGGYGRPEDPAETAAWEARKRPDGAGRRPLVMTLRRVPLDGVRSARDRRQVPSGVLRVDGSLSEGELADLVARWARTANRPVLVLDEGERDRDFLDPVERGERRRSLDRFARGGLVPRPAGGSWWRRTLCRWTP